MSKKKSMKGLEITIDPFGRIQRNINIEKVNDYLNDHVNDKKLTEKQKKDIKKGK